MGCTTSNLNDLPAVTLCRQRCAFVDEAIRHCHALSAAHLSYINSLQSVALSLQHLHHSTSPPLPDSDHHSHILPPPFSYTTDHQGLISFPASAAYMKHNATPSQVCECECEQMPITGEYSSFYSPSSSFSHANPNPPYYFYGHQTFGAAVVASSSQRPPPRIYSPWGFGNSYYDEDAHYSQDRLKKIRAEEGIPDLEDDGDDYDEYEEVRPVQEDQSDADGGADNQADLTAESSLNKTMPISSMETDERFGEGGEPRDAFEAASEIEVQFRRASESGMEIARILDMPTLPYYPKHAAYQPFSKILRLVALPLSSMLSQPSISKAYKMGPRILELDGDFSARSRNLSSTLQKLHLWEKKLYKEVKAEEKIRVLHNRKCRMLKRLDDGGADFHKVDITQTSIKNLSTKLKMAIQVVDLISVKINKIRDEELWPQVNELIQGLTRMWKSMLECHGIQCEAIREAGIVGWMGCSRKKNEATWKQLEKEVIKWGFQFCSWISAQKRYARALNNWLLKCLMYEAAEETGNSPGRMGAPRVFVICNRWSQAMERISEKEVLECMYGFTRSVLQIWEQERLEMMLDKDVEGNDDGEEERDDEQKLQKQIEAVKQKMVATFRGLVLDDDDDDVISTSLEARLQQILEAMERFTGISAVLYQELQQTSNPEGGGMLSSN